MAKETKIDWTDSTYNPHQGCRKVSPGCENCYMYPYAKRCGRDPVTVVKSKTAFNVPLKWKDSMKVFVCSLSDFFIEDADLWRDEVWEIIRKCPHHTFQILTKRPENIIDRLPPDWPLKHVWLGVTAENQQMANERIPILAEIPAKVRFVSVELMLGPVTLAEYSDCIDWVICGGESGSRFRPMKEKWAFDLMNETECAFFMKQMAGYRPGKIEIPDYLMRQEFPV